MKNFKVFYVTYDEATNTRSEEKPMIMLGQTEADAARKVGEILHRTGFGYSITHVQDIVNIVNNG